MALDPKGIIWDDAPPASSSAKGASSPFDAALAAEGVSGKAADIARSIYQQESGSGKNTKTSNAGAVGGMQIIPATFNRMSDPGWTIDNPEHNARAGVRYIKTLFEKAGGDPALTAAGYYGGEGAIDKAKRGIAVSDPRNPNAPNTLQYGAQVAGRIPSGAALQVPAKVAAIDPKGVIWDDAPKDAPKSEGSFLGNVAAGVGSGVTDFALGAKQRLDEGAAYLENKFGGQGINKALGMKNAADILPETQAAVVEKRKIDAPLLATSGGKLGAFLGKAAPAVASAFLPGGQTLAGSILAGGALGAAETTVPGESVGRNILAGSVGGGVGYGVGKGIAAGVNRLAAGREASAVANSVKDTTAASAREAGYVIPPVQTNPNMLNRTLEGLSGKISTGQSASIKNQKVTNELAAKALGLDPAQPITQEALSGLRSEAGQAYSAIKGAGTITADAEYSKALSGITAKFQGASKDFPELAKNDIEAIVSSIDKPSFSADSAVNAIKILREKADKAFGSGDKGTGKAFREASDAMENVIERNLQSMGPEAQGMLQEFRNARQLIAKTYTVEKALNGSTGNVAARKLASQLARGKPLSGELKDIGQFAQAFPKAADEVTSSMPGVSPLDFFGAGSISAATGNPLGMLAAAVRPISRATILSKPYQNALGAASYSGNPLLNSLASQPGRVMLQAGGAMSPQFAKKDRP